MKKLSLLSIAFAAISSSGFVHAGGGSLFGTSTDKLSGTYYLGAGLGKSSDNGCETNQSINTDITSASGANLNTSIDCSDTKTWKAYAGYRLSPTISVEGSYLKLGERENSIAVSDNTTRADQMTIKSKASGFNVSGVANAPLSDELNLFGKMGAIFWKNKADLTLSENGTAIGKASISEEGTDVSLGAGAEYKMNENWGLRGEYEHFNGLDTNMYSVGATFSSF